MEVIRPFFFFEDLIWRILCPQCSGEEAAEEGGSEGGVDTAGLLEVDAEDDRKGMEKKGVFGENSPRKTSI